MPWFAQFVRFIAVGGVSLSINLAVIAIGVEALALPHRLGAVGLLVAQAAGVFVSTSIAYLMHSRWTFIGARRQPGAGRVARYWAVTGAALAIQVPAFGILLPPLGWLGLPEALLPYAASSLAGVCIMVVSFLLNRYWTFRAA